MRRVGRERAPAVGLRRVLLPRLVRDERAGDGGEGRPGRRAGGQTARGHGAAAALGSDVGRLLRVVALVQPAAGVRAVVPARGAATDGRVGAGARDGL